MIKIVKNLRYLKKQYVLFVSTIILTIVTSQIIIQIDLNRQNEDARLINLAGRQRMLSQRIAKLVLFIESDFVKAGFVEPARIDTLTKLVNKWESVHNGLSNGNQQLGIGDRKSPKIDSLLRTITPPLRAVVKVARKLIANPTAENATTAVKITAEHELRFLLTMEAAVATYQLEAENKLRDIKFAEIALAIAAILVLFVEFVFIFIPLVSNIEASNRELTEVNNELAATNEELQSTEEELRSNLDFVTVLQDDLAAREIQYRNVVEHATDMIYELDEHGKFSLVNQLMQDLIGYNKEELLQRQYWDIVQPEHVEATIKFYKAQRSKKIEVTYFELPIVTRQGHIIWVGQNVRMHFRDDRVYKVSVVARDITALKQAREKMAESEKLYRLISTNAKDIITLYGNDVEPIRAYVSPSVKEVLGYDPEELIGKSPFDIIVPEDAENMRKNVHPVTLSGKSATAEYRIRKKDGSIVWLQSISSPFFNDEGKMVGFQTSARDITERRKAEEALKEAKVKAEEATKAKSQFLSMMSHEIRTPMNAIIGLSNLLLKESPRPDQQESLKLLKFSGENLLTIINDILDFSKIEAGKIDLEIIDFNLKALIENTTEMLRHRAQDKDVKLILKFDQRLPEFFKGDPVRIAQVITNLASNAVKFTEKGFVEISIDKASRDGDFWDIDFKVKDTGIGIQKEKLDVIFESFSQANSDTTRKFGGTGLGLSITKKLLELMGSSIKVESAPGKGSVFSFMLRLPVGKVSAPKQQPGSDVKLQNVKVLLVEDNRVNQIVASRFLVQWGMQVDIANHGKEALSMIMDKHYQLILMDLQMPEMDGYETARKIRTMSDPYFKKVPILALTASAMIDTRDKVLRCGMNDFISKPFQPEELKEKIALSLTSKPAVVQNPFKATLDMYSEGDAEFRREFAALLIKNIRELDRSIEETKKTHHADTFRSAAHKIKPTIAMLGDEEFLNTVERLKQLFDQQQFESELMEDTLATYKRLSRLIIEGLHEETKPI